MDASRLEPRLTARRILTIVGVLVAIAWLGWTALAQPALPDFDVSGEPIDLPEQGAFPGVTTDEFRGMLVGLRGQPVVVNIWASWCPPCRAEMPLLEVVAQSYAGEVVILGVASNDDPGAAKRFLDELGVTYPNVSDTTGDIRVALGLTAYPTTYVFDSEGNMQARVNGGISEQRLASLIEAALP